MNPENEVHDNHNRLTSSPDSSSGVSQTTSSVIKLAEAAELMRELRLAQSLTQVVQAISNTLPTIMEASVCGYLTWVQSPRTGTRWEAVTGEKKGEAEKTRVMVDRNLAEILQSGKPQIFPSGGEPPAGLGVIMDQTRTNSLMIIPVFLEGAARGVIILGRDNSRLPWVEDEMKAGNEVVMLAVSMYAMRNELSQAEQHIRELERVFTAGLDLTATLNPEDVLNSILKNALSLITDANDAHIFYYDGEKLSFGAAMFKDGSTGKVWALPRENGLTYTVARSGDMIVVEDMRNHVLYKSSPSDWKGAIVGLPLKMKGYVIGVMTLAILEPHTFHDANLRQLRLLAEQAGIAIQNARLHNLIREEAQTDWLTTLPNRRAFELAIDQMINQSKAVGGKFTLMMLDLDHFKSINDTYGHRVGDEALRRIAFRLKDSVRKTDFLARLGGDEFAILFPNTNLEEAYTIGIGLQQHVSGCDLRLPDGKLGCVSVSLGLANYPKSGLTAEELLEAADVGLYADKERS